MSSVLFLCIFFWGGRAGQEGAKNKKKKNENEKKRRRVGKMILSLFVLSHLGWVKEKEEENTQNCSQVALQHRSDACLPGNVQKPAIFFVIIFLSFFSVGSAGNNRPPSRKKKQKFAEGTLPSKRLG